MTAEHAFAIFGMAVAALVALGAICFLLVVLSVLLVTHFPRFHFGRPKNTVTLQTHAWDQIITSKNGKPIEPHEPRLVQKLGVRWWIGLSSRNKASWFFGLLSVIRHEA